MSFLKVQFVSCRWQQLNDSAWPLEPGVQFTSFIFAQPSPQVAVATRSVSCRSLDVGGHCSAQFELNRGRCSATYTGTGGAACGLQQALDWRVWVLQFLQSLQTVSISGWDSPSFCRTVLFCCGASVVSCPTAPHICRCLQL